MSLCSMGSDSSMVKEATRVTLKLPGYGQRLFDCTVIVVGSIDFV